MLKLKDTVCGKGQEKKGSKQISLSFSLKFFCKTKTAVTIKVYWFSEMYWKCKEKSFHIDLNKTVIIFFSGSREING